VNTSGASVTKARLLPVAALGWDAGVIPVDKPLSHLLAGIVGRNGRPSRERRSFRFPTLLGSRSLAPSGHHNRHAFSPHHGVPEGSVPNGLSGSQAAGRRIMITDSKRSFRAWSGHSGQGKWHTPAAIAALGPPSGQLGPIPPLRLPACCRNAVHRTGIRTSTASEILLSRQVLNAVAFSGSPVGPPRRRRSGLNPWPTRVIAQIHHRKQEEPFVRLINSQTKSMAAVAPPEELARYLGATGCHQLSLAAAAAQAQQAQRKRKR